MKLVITIANTNEVIGFEYESKEALDAKLRDNCKHMSTYKKAMVVYRNEGHAIIETLQSNRATYDEEMLERVKYIESELDLLNELCEPYYRVTSSCGRYSIPVYTHKSHGYGYVPPLMETVEEYIARLFDDRLVEDIK